LDVHAVTRVLGLKRPSVEGVDLGDGSDAAAHVSVAVHESPADEGVVVVSGTDLGLVNVGSIQPDAIGHDPKLGIFTVKEERAPLEFEVRESDDPDPLSVVFLRIGQNADQRIAAISHYRDTERWWF
jgi:hypothetical protein